MPLIIDPESSCDVCLESLTYNDPTPPYAIPCGHIFCKNCLVRTDPHNCPLCRKPYLAERAKKLITGERAVVHDSGNDILLRRLVVSWDLHEDQLARLLAEVDGWLQTRTEITSEPLRKARLALTSYKALKVQTEDYQRKISHLKRKLRHQERDATLAADTAKAIEMSLNSHIELRQNKLAEYEGEIERLRAEVLSFKHPNHLTNPLPPPPEPLPADMLPPFAQSAQEMNGYTGWYSFETSSAAHPTNPNGPANPSHAPFDQNGHRRHTGEGETTRSRDRKGKGKEKERDWEYDNHPSRDFPVNEGENWGATFSVNRNAIIPGATPNRRVVPQGVLDKPDMGIYTGYQSPPDRRDVPPVGLDLHFDNGTPHAIAPEILQEYVNGYGSGFQDATNRQAPRTRTRSSSTNTGLQSSLLDPPTGRNGRHSSRPSVPRWVTDPSYLLPDHPPANSTLPRSAAIAEDADRSIRNQRDSLPQHLAGPPHTTFPITSLPPSLTSRPVYEHSRTLSSNFQQSPPHTTPAYTERARRDTESVRPSSIRRNTVQVDGNLAEMPSLSGPASDPRRPAVRQSATMNQIPISAPSDDLLMRHSRISMDSWGTISEQETASNDDLNLRTFPTPQSVTINTPLLSFYGANAHILNGRNPNIEEENRMHNNSTPRNRPASLSESASTHRPDSVTSQSTVWPRDSPPHGQGSQFISSQPHDPAPAHRRRSSRHHRRSDRISPPPAEDTSLRSRPGTAADTIWSDAGYYADASDNALGLQITQEPIQITAPTPLVSTQPFLRSFSNDFSRPYA